MVDELYTISQQPQARRYRKLTGEPRLIVSLRVDEESEMGIVTDVQQELRKGGTLRINYSSKRDVSNL